MAILNIKESLEKDRVSIGSVLISSPPEVRSGKKNDFMQGQFVTKDGSADFKIWEERTFQPVKEHGPGIYDVEVAGSEYNGVYLTVRRIAPTTDLTLKTHDFLPEIPRQVLTNLWNETLAKLSKQGVSYKCWKLVEELIRAPELEGRFMVEGAAMRHHDNKIGGLVHHCTKMLNLLSALIDNNPQLKPFVDLLACGIIVHDIGKVYEYRDLGLGEFWYANHRIRGIEFLAAKKDLVLANYDEVFYRQLQTIIAGHHGEYGDRPTTVAAAIVHFIDTMESQVTGLLEEQEDHPGERLRYPEWGYLEPLH